MSARPLPDERPRQSVINLISRFEKETKRVSLSASSPSRSSSIVSHITGDSAKEEVKEKREWPPKVAKETEKPPIILPSLSSRLIPPAVTTQEPNNAAAVETVDVPLTAKALNASNRHVTGEPNAFLENWRKDIPLAQVEMEPEEPTPTMATSPPTLATPTLATAPKLATTSRTPNATTKLASTRTPVSASKTSASVSAKAPAMAATPAKTQMSPSVSKQSAAGQPLKAQNTGKSAASSSAIKKPALKLPSTPKRPSTPSSVKTPSKSEADAKTPTTARSKTPSSGLFAPTAASLARARNAAPPVPTPTKKAVLSSSSFDRLSKPTAASMARMSSTAPVSAARPTATAPRLSSSSSAKAKTPSTPLKTIKKEAPNIKLATAATATEESDKAAEVVTTEVVDVDIVLETEITKEIPQESVEQLHIEEKEEIEGRDSRPLPPSPEAETSLVVSEEVTNGVDLHEPNSDVVHNAKGELEEIVNLLETVLISKPQADTIVDIPDDIMEIPDEEEK